MEELLYTVSFLIIAAVVAYILYFPSENPIKEVICSHKNDDSEIKEVGNHFVQRAWCKDCGKTLYRNSWRNEAKIAERLREIGRPDLRQERWDREDKTNQLHEEMPSD